MTNLVTIPPITSQAIATILEIISDGIWDWNANTGYVYRSPGWYTMLGYDVDSLDNTVFTWEHIIHSDDYDRVMAHFESYITGKSDDYKIAYRCKMLSGDYLWIEDRGQIIQRNPDGTVARMIGSHRNIHAEKSLYEKSQQQNKDLQSIIQERTHELEALTAELSIKANDAELHARTDYLTSLSNRYFFEERLKKEAARALRFNEPLSLIIFDLDKFKPVNDQFGHATGDAVLVTVADILKSHIREIDLAARWGGDEFLILLPHTSSTHANDLAEKLKTLIRDKMESEGLAVTASFGVAQLRKDESTLQLTVRADKALYQSKHAGRNTITIDT